MRQFQLIVLLTFLAISTIYSQTDSLIFNKSEHVIGEIKHMKLGVIQIETAYSDNDFEISWDGVKEIYSKRTYIITITSGERLIGTINTNPDNKSNIVIVTKETEKIKRNKLKFKKVTVESSKINMSKSDVVNIKPLDSGFWDKLSASVDVGFTYTKANNVRQLSVRSNIGYLTDHWDAGLSFDAVTNAQDSVETTKRVDVNGSYSYFTGKRWFVIAAVNFLKNSEQKLDLRSTPKIGAGNYIIQTNHVYLGLQAGAAWNNETYTDPEIENRSSAEAYFGAEYNMFDFGDISLLTNIFAYKSIDDAERYRADFKFDIKYDLPYDFYINLGYTLNYDSVPVEGASQSDYVLQTTFGW
ncbi:MAG: DUF481 domain-containing protein, partial [Bacteroidota bacterium]